MNLESFAGFELKASYQRNMLCGTGMATLMALCIGILLSYFDTAPLKRKGQGADRNNPTALREEILQEGKLKTYEQTHSGFNPYEDTHRGFLGFHGFTVIAEDPKMSINTPRHAISLLPAPDDSESGEPEYLLHDCIPDTTDYLPPDPIANSSSNSNLELVHKDLPRAPWLAQLNDRTGYVEIVSFVDKNGRFAPFCASPAISRESMAVTIDYPLSAGDTVRLGLTPILDECPESQYFCTLKEEPKEYGFAQALVEVLPSWRFRPRIRDGKPEGTFVIIEFTYCNLRRDRDCRGLVFRFADR